jgi:hypothetical protein
MNLDQLCPETEPHTMPEYFETAMQCLILSAIAMVVLLMLALVITIMRIGILGLH